MPSVLQDWVTELPMMQQTVLLTAIRGCDGIAKGHRAKPLIRWLRRCIVLSAFDGKSLLDPYAPGGGSFTGPLVNMTLDQAFMDYMKSVDELPHHYQMHVMYAAEIIGYKGPRLDAVRTFWNSCYIAMVHSLHLHVESEKEMDRRLGDSELGWLEREVKIGGFSL